VKDIILAIAILLIVAGVCYGLATLRPELPARHSEPFSASTGASPGSKEKVVMRVNGEAITEREFSAVVSQAPEKMRTYYATEGGRRALADQIVKLKALEQEARRLGAAEDPEVRSQLALDKSNIMAGYALRKMVGTPTEAEVRSEYAKSKENFAAASLSHILIAYKGGAVPARAGEAPTPQAAMDKAKRIVARLRGGENFGAVAMVESDDTESAERGGDLGPVSPEQLPPELGQAVMKVKPGQVSDPVQSRFGIHILRVSERRTPPLERVKEALQQKIQQDKLNATLDRLQKSAKVALDPSFFGAGKQPAPLRRKAS
jgi:hypothetical protein